MKIFTDYPVAHESNDHQHPRGVKQDNTHCPAFLAACLKIFPNPSLLDLGCAGGGLVKDFADAGHLSFGLEGSDYALTHESGEWGKIPGHLGLADISKPFQLVFDKIFPAQFSFVTAWEVLEHIKEEDLPTLFANIKKHLMPFGYFVGSVSTIHDNVGGVEYHHTLHDEGWWWNEFEKHHLHVVDWKDFFRRDEFPRGSGNKLATGDWSGNEGFHIMAMPCATT